MYEDQPIGRCVRIVRNTDDYALSDLGQPLRDDTGEASRRVSDTALRPKQKEALGVSTWSSCRVSGADELNL